jgi:hypothetical protein
VVALDRARGDQADSVLTVKYQTHPYVLPPSNADIAIWRYLDLPKFVAMLKSKSLFFARLDRLEDKFEGALPQANVDPEAIATYRSPTLESLSPADEERARREAPAAFRHAVATSRRHEFVNCWCMSDESAAMWELYGKRESGIAVRSTFRRLVTSLHDESADRSLWVGVVRYLDYATARISEENTMTPVWCKRKSFEHERELRANVYAENVDGDGLEVAANLDTLIDELIVSPVTPAWYADVVRSVTEKYGLNKPVRRSDLGGDPVW